MPKVCMSSHLFRFFRVVVDHHQILHRYRPAGLQDPDYDFGIILWWRGHAVVDIDKYPLRDIRDIPSTLASKVEGGLLEAIERTDSRIRHQGKQFLELIFTQSTVLASQTTCSESEASSGGRANSDLYIDFSARLYDPRIYENPVSKDLKNRDNKLSQSMR